MSNAIFNPINNLQRPYRIFSFLILYRWLSLIPALIILLIANDTALLLSTLVTISINIVVSLFSTQLNKLLREKPWLLIIDLSVIAVIISFTGGWQTPFFLYALNPILISAFLFKFRGAFFTANAFLPMYIAAILISANRINESPNWLLTLSSIVGFFLIGGIFGIASNLVASLQTTRDDLTNVHRELKVIHSLALSLQSAVYVEDVQERVLEAVTSAFGFERAVIGLVNQEEGVITAWLGRVHDGQIISNEGVPLLKKIPISPESGLVAQALLNQKAYQTTSESKNENDWLNTYFGLTAYHVFPMLLRNHPVGVLLVDNHTNQNDLPPMQSLEAIVSQAAVAIGTTMLCIYKAQHIAVQEERLRFAQDIHDTVSQSLFGIVYTLDGSLKLLPEKPEAVIPELERALRVAEETHNEVRQSILDIWPSEITANRLKDGLSKYASDMCRATELSLNFDIDNEFEKISSQARRGLYRIAQESIANIAKHAKASEANICIDLTPKEAILVVTDNGCGFEPEIALRREYNRENFGLKGMQERAILLGGCCEFASKIGAGTAVTVTIPIRDVWIES